MSIDDHAERFAARCGKKTLYKFRPYSTPVHRKRVREILVEHRVYFSRASQINDPFDMSPRIEPLTREKLIAGAERHFLNYPGKQAHKKQAIQHLRSCDLAEHIDSATVKCRARIEDQYSIFSLAGNRAHPMLWSHYAAGHSGLCIHIRSNERSIFGAALRVKYDAKRPTLSIDGFSGSEREIFERALLTKGDFWAYEEEFRWINYPDTDWSDVPILFDGQHAHFDPRELTGITVGARMPKPEIAEVLALAANHEPQLPAWRAVEKDTFEFDFERIS